VLALIDSYAGARRGHLSTFDGIAVRPEIIVSPPRYIPKTAMCGAAQKYVPKTLAKPAGLQGQRHISS
jgi:hypothetical protein